MAKEFSQHLDPANFIASSSMKSPEGLSNKSRFLAEMTLKAPIDGFFEDIDLLRWNVLSASVPGVDIAMSSTIINQRPRYFGTERADQDVQLTFLESSDMPIRRGFDLWIGMIWDSFTGVRLYPDDYSIESLKVWSLSPIGEGVYYDEFQGVFPYNIADLDWDTAAYDTVPTVIKFKYRAHVVREASDTRKID